MARTFTYLFAIGGFLLATTLVIKHAPDRELEGLLAVAAVAELAAAGFAIGFDRLPLWVFKAAPALGSVLIGFVVYWGGTAAIGAYAMYFFWVALAAAYFFGFRVAIGNIAFATFVFGLSLDLQPTAPLRLLYWVMSAGALFVAGALMLRLREQAGQAEEARATGERATRRILETANDAFISMDSEGAITDWNPQAEATFGWTRSEAVGRELAETIVPPVYRSAHRAGLARFRETGEGSVLDKRLEMTAVHRDGREFPVEFTISALHSADGDSFHAFLRDVTQRTVAEDQLRESEERYRLLVDSVADYAIFMLDSEGKVATWNEGAERLEGYAADEALGRSFSSFYPADDVAVGKPDSQLEIAAREGMVEDEGWRVRKDGTRFWANVIVTAMRTEEGGLRGYSTITRDLTERRMAEYYRHAQHAATRVLAESGTLEEALPGLLEAVGQSMDWQVGGFWMPSDNGGPTELSCVAFWHCLQTPPVEFEAATMESRLAAGDGLPGRVWASSEPAWIADVTTDENFSRAGAALAGGLHAGICLPILSGRELVAVIEFFSDQIHRPDPALLAMLDTLSHQVGQFVQRKRAEAEADLVKAEFLASVSHELRTPLASIIGYLHLLLQDGSDEVKARRPRKFLEVIDRNSRRLLRLVGDLLFAAEVERGEVVLEREEFELAPVATGSIETFHARAEQDGVELRSEIEEVGTCIGDSGRIGQAIDNLLSNAIKFTPEGGTVTLRLYAEGADRAVIESVDTGIGIPVSDHERLFDRFYRASTAQTQSIQGTGLGLSIVKTIVEAHDGEVSFQSREGEGATFRISLPLSSAFTPSDPPSIPEIGVGTMSRPPR
jgi:PAS domain S-box-containing protein